MALFSDDLTVFFDDNGSFTDLSFEAHDYLRDDFDLTLVAAEDYIYVGLYKPFGGIFAEFKTGNSGADTLTGEFYNGSSFAALSNLRDDTLGFSRSGFIEFPRDQTDWAKTTVNGESLYWVRFKTSTDTSAMEIQGLNIVFADDEDLKSEFRKVTKLLPSGDSTFIAYHQAARDEIVQSLRNKGNAKLKSGESQLSSLTKWDVLDRGEIKQAAKFLALAKITFDASDATEDKMYQRNLDYMRKYGEAFRLYFLSLDCDDDGIKDDGEALSVQRVEVVRI